MPTSASIAFQLSWNACQFMTQIDDERRTMITCWPYETNTHWLILIARPVVQ